MFVMAEDRFGADRGKAVEAALLNIEKKFGKGSIMRLGEREVSDIPAISTTSISLDAAIGVGGVPRGRIIEIYGPESSGKTTLALHIVSEAQKAGGVAAYIDAEHAMDAEYAGKLGVDVDQLLISQPDSGEQALEIAEALVRSNGVDVLRFAASGHSSHRSNQGRRPHCWQSHKGQGREEQGRAAVSRVRVRHR